MESFNPTSKYSLFPKSKLRARRVVGIVLEEGEVTNFVGTVLEILLAVINHYPSSLLSYSVLQFNGISMANYVFKKNPGGQEPSKTLVSNEIAKSNKLNRKTLEWRCAYGLVDEMIKDGTIIDEPRIVVREGSCWKEVMGGGWGPPPIW